MGSSSCFMLKMFSCLQIKRDGITMLVVLPLYPQFSISTSGSSLRLLESIFRWISTYRSAHFCLFKKVTPVSTENILMVLQGGWIFGQHAAHSYTFLVSARRIHKGHGKLNWKGVGEISKSWKGKILWHLLYSYHASLWVEYFIIAGKVIK